LINVDDAKNGPLAKAGSTLIAIFDAFQKNGSVPASSNEAGQVLVQGSNVGVTINSTGGDLNSLISSMQQLGLQVTAQDAAHGIVTGMLPIAQLVNAAQNTQVLAMSPITQPALNR